jgi:Domain of unknown function (DUF4203)
MNDIVLGLLALLIGAVFCFRGYFAMRVIIPIWGAFAGFVLGAGLISTGGDEFLSTALSWIVGFAVALVFGLIAYLYYAVAVLLGMTAIGFVLGTTLMAALGVTWSWLVILVGVISAVVLAFVAIVGDMPMLLLTVLTAFAGATAITTGLMLLFGVIDTDGFDSTVTTRSAADDWWWYVIYLGLAIAGIISQIRENDLQQASLRAAWAGVDDGAPVR